MAGDIGIPVGDQFSSVQFICSVVSNSLQPHESQHARPPCPSPTPGVHSKSCPSSRWYHPAISSCRPLLLLPPIPPRIRIFSNESTLHMRWPKYWSFSFSISLPMNTQDCSPLGWTCWISLQSKGLSRVYSNHSSKASILWHSAFFTVQLSHWYMTTGKTIALTRWTFVNKVMSLLLNMLSRLVITVLLRSKRFFNFMTAVTICSDFGAQENKVCHCYHCFPLYLLWSDGTGCHDLCFLNVESNTKLKI